MNLSTLSPNNPGFIKKIKVRKGFSIVEVAIAMGVVTLLLTTFLGVFGPAQKNLQRALSSEDAIRMKDALSNEMNTLRSSDIVSYSDSLNEDSSSFDKAFHMIGKSHDNNDTVVLLFQYRAQPVDNDSDPNDGILPPYEGNDGIQGRDYIMQTAVRVLDSINLEDELKVVEGPVFVVRMTQLLDLDPSDDVLSLTAWRNAAGEVMAGITNPDNPGNVIRDPNSYPKAVIAFSAEFYRLKSNDFGYISSDAWDFTNIGNPVTKANMAVRR